jgi:ADP-heptose:LPS heptosyltransferase
MKLDFLYRIDRLFSLLGRLFMPLFMPAKSGKVPDIVKNIVIFKFLGGGSLTLAAPALFALKKRYPSARMILLATSVIKSNAELLDLFDDIETFSLSSPFQALKTFFKLKNLVSSQDNLVIDLELYSGFSHLVSAWISAKCYSAGLALPQERHFWNKAIFFRENIPMYQLYDELPKLVNGRVSSADTQNFYRLPSEKIDRDLLVIAPFCSNLSLRRQWQSQKFAELLNTLLLKRRQLRTVIIGAPEDFSEAERILSMLDAEIAPRVESWCGKADFAKAFEAVRRSGLFIGVDSAPLHLARLCAVPALSIWGATSPYHLTRNFENYSEALIVADAHCTPCVHRKNVYCPFEKSCTAMVKVNSVLTAAESLLDNPLTGGRGVCYEQVQPPRKKL